MKKSISITFEMKRKAVADTLDNSLPLPDLSTPPPPLKFKRSSLSPSRHRHGRGDSMADTSSPNLAAISPSIFSPAAPRTPRLRFSTKAGIF
jgi:hypothetical protein